MVQVAIDNLGNYYRIDNGYLVNIGYDESGNPFDLETEEYVQLVRIDPGTPSTGNNPIYTDITSATRDVLIAIFGNANQIPPATVPLNQVPVGAPVLTTPRNMIGVGAGVNANPGGIGGNLNISTNTLLIGGLIAFAFFFGKRR